MMSKTTIKPGYGGMPAKNVSAPAPMLPKQQVKTYQGLPK